MSIELWKWHARLVPYLCLDCCVEPMAFMREINWLPPFQPTPVLIGDMFPLICRNIPFIQPSVCRITPLIERDRIRGVTLIELLITLAVGVILLTIAVPSMTNFVESNRVIGATNDFIGALSKARDEGLKGQAAICKSGGGTTCVTTGGWESGWIVFSDVDLNGALTASDVTLQRFESISPGTAITTSSNIIVYNRQGSTTTTTFTFCNSRARQQRTIGLTAFTGRHTLAEGTC